MKKELLVAVIIIAILVVGGVLSKNTHKDRQQEKSGENNGNQNIPMSDMTLTSEAFEDGGVIPSRYTCDGENINPQLSWSRIPEDAQTLVLIMDDPDAVKPAGHVWDHWVVFDMQPATVDVKENSEPEGVSGNGSSGSTGYSGPCPPDGEHLYFFKLYALDTTLSLSEGATKAEVQTAMQGHVIAEAQLTGRYTRK